VLRLAVDRDIPEAVSAFAAFGDVRLVSGRTMTAEQIGDADVLVVRSVTQVNAALLGPTQIKFVATATSGIDHLDQNYLSSRKIEYFSAPGCNARAVAEFILACVLLYESQSDRGLAKLQVGIVGYGHVGRMVHSLLSVLGIACVINDPLLAEHDHSQLFVDIDTALASNIVTLHVPYTEHGGFATRRLIGSREFARIDPRTLLINASRGGVVEEREWKLWADHSKGFTTVIDCWEGEPSIDLSLLRLADIATPHIAGHTRDARLRATSMMVDQLSTALDIENAWRPADIESVAMTLEPGALAEVVRDAVLECCDPRIPSAALRGTVGLPELERTVEFDKFRRHAAKRGEFSTRQIATGTLQMDTVRTLGELGFRTTTDETDNDD
jgi:erythronate-4-phosphate dehydrogenase